MVHRRPRGAAFLLAAVVTCAVTAGRDATAQTVNPTTAEFTPSADHNVTLPTGGAAVTRYDLEFYNVGAASPFQVASLGKPAPAADGLIHVLLSSVLTAFPSPGIVYESRVTAVGPGGTGRSAPSNTFTFTAPCTYSIAPTSQALAAGGATGNATVSTATGCAWTAGSNASWISVTSGAAGSGNGPVSYTAAANTTTSSRTGTLTIAGQTLTVTQVACSYTLSPTTQNIAAVGGAANATVSTTSGCPWTAAPNATWLSITSGGSGSGNGPVNYSAATNTLTTPRTGTLTIAGKTLTVTQAGACIFTVSPTTHSISGGDATLSSTVTTTGGCAWTATSNASWISVTSGAAGSGNGTASYAATANTTTSSRTGTLTIAGQTVNVTQVACSYTLSPTTQNIAAVGGAANATVSTTSGCPWTAAPNATWLSITSGGSGSGNGPVNYSAATNTLTTPRTGTLTIAGKTLTVTQAGACIFTVAPTTHSISGAAATLSSTVTTTGGCAWTATSNDSWISITSGGNGSGNGAVNYSVAANTTTTSRDGTLTIAGRTVTITQAPGLAAPSNIRIDTAE